MIKTYIINLPKEKERKKHVEEQLSAYIDSYLDIEFIEAVDGRIMTEVEREQVFDSHKAFKRYGRKCKPGEIGCTLSHQQCYKKIVSSNNDYALILEDDITINITNNSQWNIIQKIIEISSKPTVLLLSGNYWYNNVIEKREAGIELVNVFDAYGTFAYLINKQAAQLLIESPSSFIADDWRYLKAKGVKLLAIHPHLISPSDSASIPSIITPDTKHNGKIHKQNLLLGQRLKVYARGSVRHFLKFIKHYERN